MFALQNTPEFYCGEPSMDEFRQNCWSMDQNVPSANYQISPDGTGENYFNFENPAADAFVKSQLEQNSPFDTYYQYHGPPQYIPLTPQPCPVYYQPKPCQNNLIAKRHRAEIKIQPTKSGSFKAIVKRKRKRTIFTTPQIDALEEIFKTKQYITREERHAIVKQLQLDDKVVKIWFQNRRLKDKREQIEEEYYSEEVSSPDEAQLDYVESEISKKTDEFGYVTLDDGVMRDLTNVLDGFLCSETGVTDNIENVSSPVYEPISPASVSDSNDTNDQYWNPSEPSESLQRLFDLQSMLSL